uniref:Uncharacterized protein n=1 Tax=Anguilla anguilla TaxID=7936 RepID=A0A0E9UU85_ANGAN
MTVEKKEEKPYDKCVLKRFLISGHKILYFETRQ